MDYYALDLFLFVALPLEIGDLCGMLTLFMVWTWRIWMLCWEHNPLGGRVFGIMENGIDP